MPLSSSCRTDWYQIASRWPTFSQYAGIDRFPRIRMALAGNGENGGLWVRWRLADSEVFAGLSMRLVLRLRADFLCDRCGRLFSATINSRSRLALLRSETERSRLEVQQEAIMLEDVENVHQLIEDDLLLALPSFMHCSNSGCGLPMNQYFGARPCPDNEHSPFAALGNLLS